VTLREYKLILFLRAVTWAFHLSFSLLALVARVDEEWSGRKRQNVSKDFPLLWMVETEYFLRLHPENETQLRRKEEERRW